VERDRAGQATIVERVHGYWGAYLVTVTIELPFDLWAFWLLGWRRRGRLGWLHALGVAWVVNLTHPFLYTFGGAFPHLVLGAEVVVVAVEAGLLWWLLGRDSSPDRRGTLIEAALISLGANACSYGLGLLAYAVGWLS
jgi:hypothetical protein